MFWRKTCSQRHFKIAFRILARELSVQLHYMWLCCTTKFYLPNRHKYLWGGCYFCAFFSFRCVCVFRFFFLTWDGWICGRVSIFHLLVSFFTLNWTVLKVEWKMRFLFLSLFHGFFHLVENPIEIVSWLWNIHGLCSESATRKKVGKQFIWIVELMFTWDAHRKASKPR